MAVEVIDEGYFSIKVSKKVGRLGVKRLTAYARFLEINKDAPKKVSKKVIKELADEITAAAWAKFKKKHNLKLQ